MSAALDDPERLAAVDPAGALADVEGSPEQWERAGRLPVPRLDLDGAGAVVVCGMGGSAVAGDAAAALAADRLPLPLTVHRGFGIPAFVDGRAVVVAVSFSGRTEETLSAFDAAAARGARLLGVSTGGPLEERCAARGAPHVRVEADGLQPRHALGWLTVPLLRCLGLDGGLAGAVAAQREVLGTCRRDVPAAANPAKRIAARVAAATLAVAYGTSPLAGAVARRLVAQLNENAKRPAHAAELPELGHNEIMAWQRPSAYDGAAVLWLREHPEASGIDPRVRVVTGALEERAGSVDTLEASDAEPLARLARLVLLVDLVSVYTAVALGQDPTPVPAIERLKKETAR